jgi:2-deoxy-D-gluconate 3-dehydrogenase
MDCFDVSGKIALVTGGRRSLGLDMASGLARAGAKVAVVATSPDPGEFGRQMQKLQTDYQYIQADLSQRQQRADVIDQVVEHFGRLDILVNNAGIQRRQQAEDFSLDNWDQVISLMLTGVFELSQAAGRVMLAQGDRGKIINIASVLSFQGGWTIPAYTAAKHGVAGLTKALANEWASRRINVNAIAPGYMDTEMCRAIKEDPVREPQIRQRIPADRWGTGEDLIGPLLFLASEASNYVHGHVLVVDGGWMGR